MTTTQTPSELGAMVARPMILKADRLLRAGRRTAELAVVVEELALRGYSATGAYYHSERAARAANAARGL